MNEFLKRNGQRKIDQIKNVPEFHRKQVLNSVENMNEIGRMLFGYDELKKYDNLKKKR